MRVAWNKGLAGSVPRKGKGMGPEEKKKAKRASRLKWWEANKEKARAANRKHYFENKEEYDLKQRERLKDPIERQKHRDRNNARNLELKTDVLTHYGKEGKLRCCWEECEVSDVDMLSLDHVQNNGAEDRRAGGKAGGELYRKLEKLGFPEGFQTLCLNHQFKKQIIFMRNRKENQ